MGLRGQAVEIGDPITFIVEECCSCGVPFAMTEYLKKERLKDKTSFYCPNGHSQSYVGKSDERLRKEAEEARKQAEQLAAEAQLRAQAERDQRLAAERELKRHRSRAKGGACPVCKRTFVQVTRHMKTQHPDFTP